MAQKYKYLVLFYRFFDKEFCDKFLIGFNKEEDISGKTVLFKSISDDLAAEGIDFHLKSVEAVGFDEMNESIEIHELKGSDGGIYYLVEYVTAKRERIRHLFMGGCARDLVDFLKESTEALNKSRLSIVFENVKQLKDVSGLIHPEDKKEDIKNILNRLLEDKIKNK